MGESCCEINLQTIQDTGVYLQFIRVLYTIRNTMGTGKKKLFKQGRGCQVYYFYSTGKNGLNRGGNKNLRLLIANVMRCEDKSPLRKCTQNGTELTR